MSAAAAPQLRARADGDALAVEVHNQGAAALRLWQHNTPWGQRMFSLLLKPAGAAALQLQARQQRFTRAVPRWDEIAPGATLALRLTRDDMQWTGWTAGDAWLLQPVQLQLQLHIEPSPEAQAHAIACGQWLADPVLSEPPHDWLTR